MKPAKLLPPIAAALLVASIARAQEAPPVIERDQEELLADMLGRGATLPGSCAWAGATVEQTRVLSWYTCAGVRVDLELRHPSDPAEAAARTEQFALRSRGDRPPPPGLVDALATRIRAREAAFRWAKPGTPGAAALPSRDERPLRALAVAAAALLLLALPMRWIYRRLAVRGSALPPSPLASIAGGLAGTAIAAALAAAVRTATQAFGLVALGALGRSPGASIAAAVAAILAWLALVLGAAVLVARTPSRLPVRARFALGIAAYVAIAFPLSLRGDPGTPFGDVVPGRAHIVTRDTAPDRPAILYRYNARGFRGPDFALDKDPDTLRVALIGDSYVWGVGVEVDDMLDARLRADLVVRLPGRRLEVLNLGVPGDNLSSHVDLYREATRLAPDVVVLCLTLPNDLSRWDVQTAHRAARRPSFYSAARFLVGDAAGPFWDVALLEQTITPAGLAHLDHEVARLAQLRRESPPPPRLVVMSFREFPAAVATRLAPLTGARIIPEIETGPDDFFRADGHPTPAGNRRFARRIAEAVERELAAAPPDPR